MSILSAIRQWWASQWVREYDDRYEPPYKINDD